MKIVSISPLQYSLISQNNTQINNSKVQNDISFSSRTFLPEQLEKSEELIKNCAVRRQTIRFVSNTLCGVTMGASKIAELIQNNSLQNEMLQGLGEILKVYGDDMRKLLQSINKKYLSIEEAGREFVERAKNLD